MKYFLVLSLLCLAGNSQALEVYPPHWFAGLQNPHLQLIIEDDGLTGSGKWEITGSGDRIDSVIRVPDSHCHILYLSLEPGMEGRTLSLQFRSGRTRLRLKYVLQNLQWTRGGLNEQDLICQVYPLPALDPDHFKENANLGTKRDRYFQTLGINTIMLTAGKANQLDPFPGIFNNHYPRWSDGRIILNFTNYLSMQIMLNLDLDAVPEEDPFFAAGLQSGFFRTVEEEVGINRATRTRTMLNTRNVHARQYLLQQSVWMITVYNRVALGMEDPLEHDPDFIPLWKELLQNEFPGIHLMVYAKVANYSPGYGLPFASTLHPIGYSILPGEPGPVTPLHDSLSTHDALSLLLTGPGIPVLKVSGIWPSPDRQNPVAGDSATDHLLRTLGKLRQSHPGFHDDARLVWFPLENGAYAYMREKDGRGVLVLCNGPVPKFEIQLKTLPEFHEATAGLELYLSLYGVDLNRKALFHLDPYEVVVIEW